MKAPAAVEAFIAKLGQDPDLGSFIYVAGLGEAGRAAGPTLVRLLGRRNWSVRVEAARTLGYVGYRAASAPLIEALRGDEDWQLSYVAAESLGRLTDPRATAALDGVAKTHWYPPVRAAARKAAEVIAGRSSYEPLRGDRRMGVEFIAYEHARYEVSPCETQEKAGGTPLTVDVDLARALSSGIKYDAKVVSFVPRGDGAADRPGAAGHDRHATRAMFSVGHFAPPSFVLCHELLLGAWASVGTRVAVTGVGVSTIGISNALAVLASHRTWSSTISASVSERIASNISL